MPNLFAMLSRDHEDVKRTLAELDKGPTRATGAGENQLALRKRMTEDLIIEESKHETVEEMYFWPLVRERVPDGNRLADEAIGQEDAPTRPHPGMRSSPGALRTTGPMVAAADRARDAVTGRGKH